MERERKPDRQGYLEYCRRIEAGDPHHSVRAADQPEKDRSAEFAQYRDMRRVEKAIDNALTDSVHTIVQRYEMTGLQRLNSNEIRKAARAEMMETAKAWDGERRGDDADHGELHRSVDFRYATVERRYERPRETEGQAWFKAKQETERAYLARLTAERQSLHRRLDEIALRAHEKDRAQGKTLVRSSEIGSGDEKRPQLGDPGYGAWRDRQRDKERGGRER